MIANLFFVLQDSLRQEPQVRTSSPAAFPWLDIPGLRTCILLFDNCGRVTDIISQLQRNSGTTLRPVWQIWPHSVSALHSSVRDSI